VPATIRLKSNAGFWVISLALIHAVNAFKKLGANGSRALSFIQRGLAQQAPIFVVNGMLLLSLTKKR
jgi:hypothetical protein